MQEKPFKTAVLGGFDKESVLIYVRDLLAQHEKEMNEKQQALTTEMQHSQELQEALDAAKAQLQKMQEEQQKWLEKKDHLEKTLLLKEDKIETQQQQLEQLHQQMEKLQSQTRQLIEETRRRCQQQIEKNESEANRRIEEARQNALDLFGKIDADYRGHRRKYADMVAAINELSNYILEAQKKANERIAGLPERLIQQDHHE